MEPCRHMPWRGQLEHQEQGIGEGELGEGIDPFWNTGSDWLNPGKETLAILGLSRCCPWVRVAVSQGGDHLVLSCCFLKHFKYNTSQEQDLPSTVYNTKTICKTKFSWSDTSGSLFSAAHHPQGSKGLTLTCPGCKKSS